jgi:hypothetical protein
MWTERKSDERRNACCSAAREHAARIAVGVAIQQYAVNRRQYRLALFDRRMLIFNRVMNFISSVVTNARVTHAIANTTTQPLYQTERYDGFSYTFTGLPAGSGCVVTLKFSENYWTGAGERLFNVILNGTTVLSNFDIFADAGGQYIADDKTFSTTVNSSGEIVIQFQNGSVDYAKIDAIQLVP